MGELSITVAICTWNRCRRLARVLESMATLEIAPDVSWELLVVDNGSDDGTAEVARSFASRLPIRVVREPAPGLSNARNRAVIEARGDYIVWTDDDVVVASGWLAAYARAFRRWPDADVFGGPIEPLFEGCPPAWLERVMERIGPVYGRQSFGEAPVELRPESVAHGPYGGNMAMTRRTLLQFHFDPELGVRRQQYRVGEETQLIRRILETGRSGWWTPEARLQHVIPQESQSTAYVRRWMEGEGRSSANCRDELPGGPARRLRLAVEIGRLELTYWLRRLVSPPEVWIHYLALASQARGRLRAAQDRRRAGRALTDS